MQNILNFLNHIQKIEPRAKIEIPPDINFGNLATNAPMVAGKNREIVKIQVFEYLKTCDFIKKYEYVEPGFINIFLNEKIFNNLDNNIKTIKQEKINVEYCSPNPNGPLHLGHYRGTIIGDCVCRLFQCAGYEVTKEMYINDQGNQINLFFESFLYHYNNLQNKQHSFALHYPGEYVKDLAQFFIDNNLQPDIKKLMEINIKAILEDLNLIKVQHNILTHESSLKQDLTEVIDIFKEKNLLRVGKVKNQKNEEKNLIIEDKVLQREDGTYTYFAFDIAYHYNKLKRGFQNQICVLGEDHAGHIDVLKKVLCHLKINLKVLKVFIVKFYSEGQQITMSKRSGTFITVKEILQKIDEQYLKYLILSKNANQMVEINIDQLNNTHNELLLLDYIENLLTKNIDFNQQIEVINIENFNLIEQELLSYVVYWPIVFQRCLNTLDMHQIMQYGINIAQKVQSLEQNNDLKNKILLLETQKILQIISYILNL